MFGQSMRNFVFFILHRFGRFLQTATLKCDSSSYSHDFISSLQSCYLIRTIDKPTRVRSSSATLIDNIFINNPDQVVTCGNIVSDISDHFSQFCVLKSVKDKVKVKG